MAYRKKRRVDVDSTYDTGIPTFSKIGSMIKKIIAASQYDFYESEAFEVKEVILEDSENRGAVLGTFINNPKQAILGGVVKPLFPNITHTPVVGEHVVVAEYNGQHYYVSIINRKNSVNENSIPGASGEYVIDTKYGETFERSPDVKPILIKEGDIVFEGRFGQSIKFTENNNNPQIKLVAGHRKQVVNKLGQKIDMVLEDIDRDDSSIHITGGQDGNKKVEIKSDDIFITGKKNLYLEAEEVFINGKAQNTIKMGDPRAPMIPTVRGDVLLQFQADILSFFGDIQQLFNLGDAKLQAGKAATLVPKIDRLTEVVTEQKFLNKKIMTAVPDFELPPLPEPPEFEVPELPSMTMPEVPNVSIPEVPDIKSEVNVDKINVEEKLKNLKKQ